MKKSVAKNYLFNLSYQAILALTPLITQPYLARVIGVSGLGKYSYTQSIVTYFILLGSLGINVYGQREIAFNQEKPYERSKVFEELSIIKFSAVLISATIYYFFIAKNSKYHLLFFVQLLDIISVAFDITWFFQGLEEFKKIAVRNCIIKGVGIVLIFIFVKDPSDLAIYVLCCSSTLMIGNISLWLFLPYYFDKVPFKELNIIKHLKCTFLFFIPQIATSIYTVLDRTMIGVIYKSTNEVGYYDQAQKIIYLLLTLVTSMGTVMMPRIASLYAHKRIEELKELIYESFHFVFLLSLPIVFGVIVIANNFSIWYWGVGFARSGQLMKMISPIIIIVGLSNVLGLQYLLPTGHERFFTISVVSGSIANMVFNIFLIPLLGAFGASLASVVAEVAVLGVQLYFSRKEIDVYKVVQRSWKCIIASIAMFLVLSFIQFNGTGFMVIVKQIVLGFCVYGVLLLLMKDSIVIVGLDKLKFIATKIIKPKYK